MRCAAAECDSQYNCRYKYREQGSSELWAEALVCDIPVPDGEYCDPGKPQ